MKYFNGQEIDLGDIVSVTMSEKRLLAKVVMIGETKESLELDKQFLEWVEEENLLDKSSVIIQWIGKNPLEHNDPNYAPVGNEVFNPVDEDMKLEKKTHLTNGSN